MNSIHANPQFSGTDYADKNSFILKTCLPCIGAGTQAEENMGEHDFYGNALAGSQHRAVMRERPLREITPLKTIFY